MSEFDYEVRYKPGGARYDGTVLPSLPVNLACLTGRAGGIQDPDLTEENGSISITQIKKAQRQDRWCWAMLNYLRRKDLPLEDEMMARNVVLNANRYLIRGDGVLAYLPHHRVYSAPEMGMAPVIWLPEALRPIVMNP